MHHSRRNGPSRPPPRPSSSSGSSTSSTSTLTSSSSTHPVKMPRIGNSESSSHHTLSIGSLHNHRHAGADPGYFEPSITTSSTHIAAASGAARHGEVRKRSQTDSSNDSSSGITPTSSSGTTLGYSYSNAPTSTVTPIALPVSSSGLNAAVSAVAAMPKMERGGSSTMSIPVEKEKKESKMKLFSKTSKITGSSGTSRSAVDLASRNSPNMKYSQPVVTRTQTGSSLTSNVDSSRRPSFTQQVSDGPGYSSSPPQSTSHLYPHHHKHQFLLRGRNHQPLSSASSNSKVPMEGASMYSFAPSSPSVASFTNVGVGGLAGQNQKNLVSVGAGSGKDAAGEQVLEDVWPALKSRVLPLFVGEGLRIPVEDLNKLVVLHIKRQFDRNTTIMLIEDVRSVLDQGMQSLDNANNLAKLGDERLIPRLVEIWNFVFSNVIPYFEAVFLPLQQEFRGVGTVMSAREAREAWGVTDRTLDIRRMTLISYRDNIILPLHGRLRIIFSKLQLDFDSLPNVTETVGRVLQCVSVLASVLSNDDKQEKMDELAKTLKHNWLSRGRTGRNRRGFVGTKTRGPGSISLGAGIGSIGNVLGGGDRAGMVGGGIG